MGIRIKHVDYLSPQRHVKVPEQWYARSAVWVMKRGLSVNGRVTDAQGNPIPGARAMLGSDRWGSDDPDTKTDADGRFELKNCKSGPSVVTIQAEGFAPDLKRVVVDEKVEPVRRCISWRRHVEGTPLC
ncbi:unnamed protein product [marine sediment metagenome]|uniref:Carboxypeptidase regulatory-like domain-containing protein n=1 Tax=marine sediment metagenome TaxID=412755 RepID=X0VVZ1_9ZZZZ